MTTLVVGGGISGLTIAHHLEGAGQDWALVERGATVGGRIRTVRDEDGGPLYEAGAWRVHSSHSRTRAALRAVGLTLHPGGAAHFHQEARPFSTIAADEGYVEACAAEHATGYVGMLDGATATYGADRHPRDGAYMVVREGYGSLCDRLAAALPRERVHLKSVVMGVRPRPTGGYEVAGETEGRPWRRLVGRLVLAVSPHQLPPLRDLRPIRGALRSQPLHHLYVRTAVPTAAFRAQLDPAAGGVIAPTHDPHWVQASYAGGRLARAWYDRVLAGDDVLARLGGVLERLGVEGVDYASHYWPHAVHQWVHRPSHLRDVAVPHPVHLPQLYLAGEAYSGVQGWVEGALESVEVVLRAMASGPRLVPRPLPTHHIRVEGRVVDVGKWMAVHPGGEAAIARFLGGDATAAFRRVNHSDDAAGRLLALQTGFAVEPGFAHALV